MTYSWRRNLFVLWAGVFFCSTAYSMVIPFLPLFLNSSLGVHDHLETWSGFSFGITFLAGALISPYWGSLSDKYGRKPMLLRSGFSLSALYFVIYFVHNPYELLVVRVFQGLLAGYVPSAIALVATNTPEEEVGYALGVMSTAGATGTIIGPLIGGFVSHWVGNRDAFLVAGVVVMIAAFIAWIWAKEANFDRKATRSHVIDDLREAASNRPLVKVLGMVMLTTTSIMILEPLITIYVLSLGSAQKTAALSSGIIFSAVGIATVLAAPRWGKVGSRIGHRKTLLFGLIGGGIGNLLQLGFHNLVAFGLLRFCYGLFFAAVYPSLNSLIVKSTDPSFRGRAFSLNQSANQIGTMMGPMVGGVLGSTIGIRAVFVLNGLALLVTAGVFKLRSYHDPSFQTAVKLNPHKEPVPSELK
ncbi:MAG: transporter [Bacilli bacterium]|nr:transporter [Bacilli bacterium]